MEWLSSRRQFLMDVSSRKTMGRPVPKLILNYQLSIVASTMFSNVYLLTDDQTNKDTAKCVQKQLFDNSVRTPDSLLK